MVVETIRKQVITLYRSTYSSHNTIRIDKSSDLRIIITALEVVEPRFRIEIVTAVEKGIERTGGCARIGVSLGGKQIAPCVIEIGNAQIAVRIVQGNHISLRVGAIIEDRAFHTAGIGVGWVCVMHPGDFRVVRCRKECYISASLAARIPRHLSGELLQPCFGWEYPNRLPFPKKAMLAETEIVFTL